MSAVRLVSRKLPTYKPVIMSPLVKLRALARRVSRRSTFTRGAVLLAVSGVPIAACSSKDEGPEPQTNESAEPADSKTGEGGAAPSGDDDERSIGEQACRSDDDCPSGEASVCDPVEGCVQCLFDWDCPAAHRCDERTCIEKKPCGDDSDCGDDSEYPVCDPVLQQCVGCREDSHCEEGERCGAGECSAVSECVNSRDCRDGDVCNAAVGLCVACVVDGDCGDASACVDSACVPRCASDKECLGLGLLCDQGLGRCVECIGHQDCPDVYHCSEASVCELDICEQGQTQCESNSVLLTCNSAGFGFDGSTCSGGSGCIEDGAVGSCVTHECTPSAVECAADGLAVIECSSDGFEATVVEQCESGEACLQGRCEAVICEAGGFTCDGRSVLECNAAGTSLASIDFCSFDEVCDSEAGACVPLTCVPNELSCDGDQLRTCNLEGTGFTGEGTDCASTGEACFAGACQPKVCEGEYVCVGADLLSCENNGTETQNSDSCGAEALCNAAAGQCDSPVCTPGAFVCDGDVATRCKADGSGFVEGGQDCSASSMACDGGGCLPVICEPSVTSCVGGSPQRCGPLGTTTTRTDTCVASEYCAEGNTFCRQDVCAADQPVCDGEIATTCAADGSGPLDGGTDCSATGQACSGGRCADVVCTPGVQRCSGADGDEILQCSANGVSEFTVRFCSSAYFCATSDDVSTCELDICAPGVAGCDGEYVATCSLNGGGWGSRGVNCAATGEVCSNAVCVAEEVATQGQLYYSTNMANQTSLSTFDVLYPRTLNEIEAYVRTNGTKRLTWVVYEKREASSTYDLVYQQVTATDQAEAGWASSGALDFDFQADHSYAVGVHTDETITGYYRGGYGTAYLPSVSFARGFSVRTESSYGTPAATETLTGSSYTRLYMRFTTELVD